jgi:MFS family permease
MLAGLALLPPALGLLVATQMLASMPLLLVGTALGGIAIALGYRGSLEVINDIAPAEQRAEVLASYIVCCYVGVALPVIGVGVLTAFMNALVADLAFAIVIAILAVAAFVTGTKFAPR